MANDHIADDRKKVRLVDANAYPCQTCEVSYCYKNCKKFDAWFNKTVDAVEVVRCKDCVNYCGFEHCKNGICDVDSVSKRAVYPDDFCSYGERR